MKSANKIDTEVEDIVQLVSNEEVEEQFGEALASAVAKDQVVTWARFILTDDKPNGNNQRIPVEEFDNLIKTGVYKPVKMALGEIKDGHEDAKPIGVITNLIKEGNKIVALAALWNHERTDDIAFIKNKLDSNQPVNFSWEILYEDSKTIKGITDLFGTMLKAVTIVGIPAYKGRTQLLAVAATAKKWSPAYIQKLPDTSFLLITNDGTRYFPLRDENGKIDPSRFDPIIEEIATAPLPENTLKGVRHQIKKLSAMISADASLQEILEIGENINTEDYIVDTKELEVKVSDLETKLALANDTLQAKEKELSDAKALFDETTKSVKSLEEELNPLREFKQNAESLAQKEAKLSGIKAKFESLHIVKDETYFAENTEKFLSMDESTLDFMLQEMAAFKSDDKATEASLKLPKVPVISGKEENLNTVSDIVAALRERNNKK